MKHLESFEAAAESLGKDPKVLPGVEGLEPALGKATVAAYKLFVISQAAWAKAGKKIDWKDSDQYKYYPWFRMGSAAGFSCRGFSCGRSYSGVGSRLVFPDSKTAKYVGEQHLELYRDMMVIED